MRPEAAAAGREFIPKTISFIVLREIAAAADGAGRKTKALYLLAIGYVRIVQPDIQQVSFIDIADNMSPGDVRLAVQVAGMGMHKWPTRADPSIPTNG